MIFAKPLALKFVALLTCVVAGCSPTASRPEIRGSVTYNGAPAAHQTLTMHSADPERKFSCRAFLDADGKFSDKAAETGEYTIVIDPPMAASEGRSDAPGARLNLPAKYRNLATTPLTWTIKSGVNRRDFVLTD